VAEAGGFILEREDEYEFVAVTNQAAPEFAPYLYLADLSEFGKKVLARKVEGWSPAASWHTHPQFRPSPSWKDISELFQSFPVNYIYAPLHGLVVRYQRRKGGKPEENQNVSCWWAPCFNKVAGQLEPDREYFWEGTEIQIAKQVT
jgi:proteasome lid subunit RPN8/RPN11